MTTEVLRNMIYARSGQLDRLGYVVMDEVHYLADRFRGAVWEEVILQLPEHVALVSLSATVSNAEEFGDWLVTVRGDTTRRRRRAPAGAAVAAHDGRQPAARPVRADAGRRRRAAGRPRAGPRTPASWTGSPPPPCGTAAAAQPRGGRRRRRRVGFRPPSRITVLDRLDRDGLLPAITFVFSRAGCDAAVAQCVRAGLRLTTEDEVAEIRRDRRAAHRRPAAGRPGRAGLLGVARGAGARHRRAPRRAAAGVQGDRRGAVRPRPGAGGVRHRDPRAGHQHARPHRRAGAAGQVQRRGARRADPRRVHPAHRAGRPARHRRRGPRRRGLAARGRPAAGRRAGLDPHLPAAQLVPARLQHGRQPRRPARRRRRAGAAGAVVRAVPGRPVGGRAGPADRAQHRGARRVRGVDAVPPRRLRRVRRAAPPGRRAGEGAAPAGHGRSSATRPTDVAARAAARRRHRGAGRAAGRAGRRARPRAWTPATSRARWCSPRTAGPAGCRRPTSRRRSTRAGPDAAAAQRSTTARPRCAATWRRRCATPASSRPRARGAAARASGAGRRPGARHAAPGAARAPLPRLRRPGGARPVGRAARPAGARDRAAAAEGPRHHALAGARSSTGSARCWASAATCDGERDRHRARASGWPGCGASRTCWPPSACGTASGTAWSPPSWPRSCPRWSTSRAGTSGRCRGCRPGRCRRRWPRPCGCGPSWRPTSAGTGSTAPASRTSGSPGRCTGGRAGESLSAVLTAAEQNGAELSAGDFVRWCRQVLDLLDQVAGVAGRDTPVGQAAAAAARSVRRGVVAAGTA